MPKIQTFALAFAAVTAASLDTCLGAQDVVLSEIGTDASGTWIELCNRDAAPADLSTWSLYLATATPLRAHTYWWALPAGTVIPGNGFLLVRWLAPVPSTPVAGEVATGTAQYGFLFGLGAEQLPLDRGALGLLRSQLNEQMNSPAIVADWVCWGSGGLPRESLAVQAGVWAAGHATPARAIGMSLARHPSATVTGAPEQSWFVDDTPTPGEGNVGAARVEPVGQACTPIGHHLLGAPTLAPVSVPVLGNGAFALRVDNTTGVFLEHVLFAFTEAAAPLGLQGLLPPTPGTDCRVFVDPSTWLMGRMQHTSVLSTTLPLSLANLPASLAGLQFSVQALVFDDTAVTWPAYQGVSNALTITLGS